MTEFEMVDDIPPPSPSKARRGRTQRFIAATQENPGKWLVYGRNVSRVRIYDLRQREPKIDWQFRAIEDDRQTGTVYGRWPS